MLFVFSRIKMHLFGEFGESPNQLESPNNMLRNIFYVPLQSGLSYVVFYNMKKR